MFELRTQGKEEYNLEIAEKCLAKKIKSLSNILKQENPNIKIIALGTYLGNDEPPLDLSQNENLFGKNNFWIEFNTVFPSDSMTRWTAADQISMSFDSNDEEKTIQLYNRLVGLSPLLIYAFSTSSIIRSSILGAWNKRQQIIDSKGIRSGTVIPGTYPLYNQEQYFINLDRKNKKIENRIKKTNPLFFSNSPRELVNNYRGSDWGFTKLCTDQVVRFNQQYGKNNSYLELRSPDSQECTKATVAIAWLCKIIANLDDIDRYLPRSEKELIFKSKQTIMYGEKGYFIINNNKIKIIDYSEKIADILEDFEGLYANIVRERLRKPPCVLINEMKQEKKDIVSILDYCLINNKSIYEFKNSGD